MQMKGESKAAAELLALSQLINQVSSAAWAPVNGSKAMHCTSGAIGVVLPAKAEHSAGCWNSSPVQQDLMSPCTQGCSKCH